MTNLIARSFGGNFFSRYLSKNLAELLPRRIKRLLYVSSVLGMVLQSKNPDPAIVSKVNEKLQLAYSASGMLFPIYIGSIIWKSLKSNVIMLQTGLVPVTCLDPGKFCDMDCWRTGLFFARNSPDCLRYASDETMTADVHDMLVTLAKAA